MTEEKERRGRRLMSLDALRGFDMWFITGGSGLITALCAAFGCGDCWLAVQMRHVEWAGLAHHDTIFPLFLFLAGVSWPFSLAKQLEGGKTSFQIHRKVIVRALTLFALGLIYCRILDFKPTFRLMGVLNFIGLSWGVAALLFIHVKGLWRRFALVAMIAVGFTAALAFGGGYTVDDCLIPRLDRAIWPNHLYKLGVYEPESFFSLPGGIVLAFLGMCAGAVLESPRIPPLRKTAALFAAAPVFAALSAFLIYVVGEPIVKALWTNAFVFAAAAYACFMLALFHYIVDVRGWRRWTLYFRVIGMNSITIYLVSSLVGLGALRNFLFRGLASLCPAQWNEVVLATGYLVVVWVFLYFLYRKSIFLKV